MKVENLKNILENIFFLHFFCKFTTPVHLIFNVSWKPYQASERFSKKSIVDHNQATRKRIITAENFAQVVTFVPWTMESIDCAEK